MESVWGRFSSSSYFLIIIAYFHLVKAIPLLAGFTLVLAIVNQGSADRCKKSFSRVNYLIILAVLLAMMALKLTKVLMLLILAVVSIILIVRSGVLKELLGGKDKDKRR